MKKGFIISLLISLVLVAVVFTSCSLFENRIEDASPEKQRNQFNTVHLRSLDDFIYGAEGQALDAKAEEELKKGGGETAVVSSDDNKVKLLKNKNGNFTYSFDGKKTNGVTFTQGLMN